jgi:hypothetical protein
MKTRHVYLALSVLGLLVPNAAFAPWILEHGFSPQLFLHDLFANGVSGFFALDVVISAVVVCAFATIEGRRLRLPRWWLAIAAVMLFGVSLALPLFLYQRQLHLDAATV